MDDFLKMDVFFVITTVSVAVVSVAVLVVLVYAVRVMRIVEQIAIEAREVAKGVREASERAIDDVGSVRDRVVGMARGFTSLFGALRPVQKKSARARRPKSSSDTN